MGWKKKSIALISVVLTTGIVLEIGKSYIMYSLYFDEKVEKYDQHIVLYVDNIFVRSRFAIHIINMKKISCLKRNLNKKELKDAIQKYGDPDDSYQE